MRRSLAALLVLCSTLSCAYIFELPAQQALPVIEDEASAPIIEDAADEFDRQLSPPRPTEAFCSNQAGPLYCQDFDTALVLDDVGAVSTDGGTIALTSTISRSPERSIAITGGFAGPTASISRELGASPETVRLSIDVLVTSWTSTRVTLAQLEIGPCRIGIYGTATNWGVEQSCNADAPTLTESPALITPRQWQRVAVAISLLDAKPITLSVDGTNVIETTALPAIVAAPTTATFGVLTLADGNLTAFVDNILVQ